MQKPCGLGFLGKNDNDRLRAKAHIGVTNGKKVTPILFLRDSGVKSEFASGGIGLGIAVIYCSLAHAPKPHGSLRRLNGHFIIEL